jgi:hypothetical protein
VAGAVDEGDVALQPIFAFTAVALARRVHLLVALERPVTCWARALRVVALVDLCVRITQLNGDITLQLVLETHSLHTRNSLDYRTLAVGDVADGTDVDCGLARYDLGRQWAQLREVYCAWVGLLSAACQPRARFSVCARRLTGARDAPRAGALRVSSSAPILGSCLRSPPALTRSRHRGGRGLTPNPCLWE